jgi:hypothetical protein
MKILQLLLPILILNTVSFAQNSIYDAYAANPAPCASERPMIIYKKPLNSSNVFWYYDQVGILSGKLRCELARDKFYLANGGNQSILIQNRNDIAQG